MAGVSSYNLYSTMLRFLLLLCCPILPILAQSQCPDGYKVMGDGRCIRALIKYGTAKEVESRGIEACQEDNATLPIIRSEEENAMFNKIALTFKDKDRPEQITMLLLGTVCNTKTHNLEWMDGTQITYTRDDFYVGFDCVKTDMRVVSEPDWNMWDAVPATSSDYWTLMCVAQPTAAPATTVRPNTTPAPSRLSTTITTPVKPSGSRCGDYETIVDSADETKPCFKIIIEPMSWNDAQKKCAADSGTLATINSAQENKFFWRSAVSQNVMDDLHIGAYQYPTDGTWRWIDGNAMITHYKNFVGGFPISGLGNCVGMLTESSNAQWVNEDCDNQKLPFVCRRSANSPAVSRECPHEAPPAGTDIVAPGFPTPDVPCEYTFVVDAKSRVQLQILSLEANPNVDFLEVYEGGIGKNILANLTGTNPNPSTYSTKSSNVMRVNWKPNVNNRPAEYRGFKVQYKALA